MVDLLVVCWVNRYAGFSAMILKKNNFFFRINFGCTMSGAPYYFCIWFLWIGSHNEHYYIIIYRWLNKFASSYGAAVVEQQMTLTKAQAGVKNNMRRMNKSIIQNGSNHVFHVILFALFCFFIVYFWSKISRWQRD